MRNALLVIFSLLFVVALSVSVALPKTSCSLICPKPPKRALVKAQSLTWRIRRTETVLLLQVGSVFGSMMQALALNPIC